MDHHPVSELSALAQAFLSAPPCHPEKLSLEGRKAWRDARLDALRREDAAQLKALSSASLEADDQTGQGQLLSDAFEAKLPITPLLTQVARDAPRPLRAALALTLLDGYSHTTFAKLALLWQDDAIQRQDAIAIAMIQAVERGEAAADLVGLARPYLGLDPGLRRLNSAWPSGDLAEQQAYWPLIQAWVDATSPMEWAPLSDAVQVVFLKGLRLAAATDDEKMYHWMRQVSGVWGPSWGARLIEQTASRPMPRVLEAFWRDEPLDQRHQLYAELVKDGIDLENSLDQLALVPRVDPSIQRPAFTRALIHAIWKNTPNLLEDDLLEEMDRFSKGVDPSLLLNRANRADGIVGIAQRQVRQLADRLLPLELLADQAHWLEEDQALPRTRSALRQVQLTARPVSSSMRPRRRS